MSNLKLVTSNMGVPTGLPDFLVAGRVDEVLTQSVTMGENSDIVRKRFTAVLTVNGTGQMFGCETLDADLGNSLLNCLKDGKAVLVAGSVRCARSMPNEKRGQKDERIFANLTISQLEILEDSEVSIPDAEANIPIPDKATKFTRASFETKEAPSEAEAPEETDVPSESETADPFAEVAAKRKAK